ncbi:MAG: HAMP domain-containing histidine kinase [Proteobacteria bacterium]|nr:HAMP domain-containing histidine kinase [Pseudomonadota bacterium]
MALANLLRSTVFRRTLGVVLILAGIAAGVIAAVGWRANAILTRAAEDAIATDAAEFRAEFNTRGFDALVRAVAERSASGGGGVYYLADASGTRRAGNIERPPVWEGGGDHGLFRYSRRDGGKAVVRTGAGLNIDIDGSQRLVVGRDVEEQRALLLAIYRSIGLGAGLLALIGLCGSLLITRHVLARIDAMGQASSGIMAGNLAARIPLDGSHDELDRLAMQLNDMVSRIEQLLAGLREVSDNIAHDLRTPLNRLRNRAEAALSDARGGPAWRDGLERVIDEADGLIKTFNALLQIARLEAGSAPDAFETFDLAQLVADVAELYEPVADEAGFRLTSAIDRPLPIHANSQLIGQTLANLVDNALKYAATGAAERAIRIEARRDGEAVRLVVADRGPGIAPEDRERALKRFVRLEQSRSQPGTGLGLSLVAAVARINGGSLALEDNKPGLRVVLTLPLVASGANVPERSLTPPRETEHARG